MTTWNLGYPTGPVQLDFAVDEATDRLRAASALIDYARDGRVPWVVALDGADGLLAGAREWLDAARSVA